MLADFLLEIPGEVKTTAHREDLLGLSRRKGIQGWSLYTKGASSKEGLGTGLILTSPDGEEITYALRFDFHTSNNEVDYEALLVDLRLARQIGTNMVIVLMDSRLAANQVWRV